MTEMETAQRNGTMPEAVRATAMMKTEILQKNQSSVMLSMRTTKPCVTATAETEACSGKKMPKETVRSIISPHWRIRRIHSLCHASASAHRGMNSAIPMIRSAEGSAPKLYRGLRSTATMDCITSAASKTRKEM